MREGFVLGWVWSWDQINEEEVKESHMLNNGKDNSGYNC